MIADSTIVEILDETTQALTALDLQKLLELEERVKLWASSATSSEMLLTESFQRRYRRLSLTLDATASNLKLLRHVCGKETGNQWAL